MVAILDTIIGGTEETLQEDSIQFTAPATSTPSLKCNAWKREPEVAL